MTMLFFWLYVRYFEFYHTLALANENRAYDVLIRCLFTAKIVQRGPSTDVAKKETRRTRLVEVSR